ncbi:ABC transporter substrate-binding protein [Radiobacillus sp. PE A8.2]|uniref:ABC transporter substrate-binding protein n=1 Tax=Radiobacillus sp. PE A8.2 TaxID=3380349 RepID=UPI00388E6C61
MKKNLFLAAIFLIFALLIGCSDDSGQQSEEPDNTDTPTEDTEGENDAEVSSGGSVTVASNSEPANLNPVVWATTSDTVVTHMIYDSLVIPDEELKMVGSLAKDWDLSEDGKTYTFHLNEGITWHDGEPFTAEDVAFTFTSIADPSYDAGAYWRVEPVVGAAEYHAGEADSVEGIEVIDQNTISFTTKEAYAPFISGLFIGVLPKHILGDVPPGEWEKHDSNRNPIGTGPFEFVEWKTGQYIEVAKNEDYFKEPAKLDSIFVRFGDANSMLASFMSKEIDITAVPVSEVQSVSSLDYSELITQSTLSVYYVGFNARNEHFGDKLVRQALAHAVDKNAIVASILGEYGTISDDVFPSKHWSHNPDLPTYEFDTATAESLLEEAGYAKNGDGIYEKDGQEISFTLEVPTGNKEREKTATLLKQMWEEVGVKVELQTQDFATLVTKLLPQTDDGKQREVTADDFAAYILGFGVEADPDEYRSYFGSSYMPPNGYNFVGYSDPDVDEMLEAQTLEVDLDARQQLIWDVGQKLAEDEIWIPLYEQDNPFVFNKRVAGFEPDFRGITFTAENWSVTE